MGTVAAAEPVLLDAARRLDPPRLRKVVTHLCEVVDPDAAVPTFDGMVAVDGPLDPEAGETLRTALEPLARPSTADDDRSAAQRRADALTELARRQLQGGGCRKLVGAPSGCGHCRAGQPGGPARPTTAGWPPGCAPP